MSPNMPANVLRKFFIVSSASSVNVEVGCWPPVGGTALAPERCADDVFEVDEIVEDWDAENEFNGFFILKIFQQMALIEVLD